MVKIQSMATLKKMTKKLNQPKQERTQKRMNQVIQTTQQMLIIQGIEAISIPEVAKISGVPRTSIYQFFPTKYDLLRHIGLLHLNDLIDALRQTAIETLLKNQGASIEKYGVLLTAGMIKTAAKFYNQSEIASMIILSGPFTRQAYIEYQTELQKVSEGIRQALNMIDIDDYLPQHPDCLTILIELVLSCMKHGYYKENQISMAICQEAYRIAIAYLVAIKSNTFQLPEDENILQ